MPWVYRDRAQAGAVLATHLAEYYARPNVTVVALPRGGVAVGYPVALVLDAPLDILAVRKLGVPGQEELAMGAVAAGGVRVLNDAVVSRLGIDPETVAAVTVREQERLADQERRLRGAGRPRAPLTGRLVVLVDDGLATGSTMEAAIVACRQADAAGIVVAVPVGAPATVAYMARQADRVVCPAAPREFQAVGMAYQDFSAVTDHEVMALLDRAAHRAG